MSEDAPGRPNWKDDPSRDRMTRIAAAITNLVATHPEGGEDLHGIITIRDEAGGSAAGAFGYGDDPGFQMVADFIRFAGKLFSASGIRMGVRIEMDGEEKLIESYASPLPASDPGQPEATLIIAGMEADDKMERACQIITAALEQDDLLEGARVVIMLGREDQESVLMHHGYGSLHEVTHTLIAALQGAVRDDGGHVVAIPIVGGHPN